MTKKELKLKLIEFVESQQDYDKDEFYGTDKDMAEFIMDKFMEYMRIEK
jgi:hypothetical protein